MHVAIVALSSRGAMGHYLDCLASSLSPLADVSVYCPRHTELNLLSPVSGSQVHTFETGASRAQALLRLLSRRSFETLMAQILVAKPDVVHLLSGEGYPWALLLARRLRENKIPLMTTVHDPRPHSRDIWGQIGSVTRRSVLGQSRCLHVHSASQIQCIQLKGLVSCRIRVIPHGSFHVLFPPCETSSDQTPVVLFWGRIEHYKGIDTFVDAAKRLTRQGVRFVIAGPGRIPRSIALAISRSPGLFEVDNRYLTNAEVSVLLARSSVCVLPYRNATQSAIPLIAASRGIQIVATAVGAFIEDIPELGGFLVPPENPAALADGIVRALHSEPTRFPHSRTFEALAPSFLEAYRACLD